LTCKSEQMEGLCFVKVEDGTRITDNSSQSPVPFLLERPRDVLSLELLLELEAVAAQEFDEREPADLVLVGKPAGVHESLELLGERVGHLDLQLLKLILAYLGLPGLDMPQIVGRLDAKPEAGSVAAKPPKAHRHLRRVGRAFGKNRVQHLPGDAELPRRLGNGEVECREHILAQDRTGMHELHSRWLLGGVLRYC